MTATLVGDRIDIEHQDDRDTMLLDPMLTGPVEDDELAMRRADLCWFAGVNRAAALTMGRERCVSCS
jgi:hypothetical protein